MTNLNPVGVPRVNRTPARRPPPKITPIHDAIFHTPKPAPARQPPPRTEAAAGGGYGIKRAAQFRRTPAYHQAARAATQARRQQLAAQFTHRGPARTTIAPAHQPLLAHVATGLVNVLSRAVSHGPIGTSNVAPRKNALPGATVSPGLIGAPSESLPSLVMKNVAIATYHHPGAVLGHTTTGLAEMLAGIPAGLGELTAGTVGPLVTGHPGQAGRAVGRYASAFGHDVSRRYGPLMRGDEKTFQQRIVKEGAAPELLDLSTIAVPGGAAAGRTAGAFARSATAAERFPRLAELATAPRPLLRTSGNLAREQELHPNLIRAVGQRGEDVLRQRVLGRRNQGSVARGLQPRTIEGPVTATGQTARGAGEVVPLVQGRAQRIGVSKVSSVSYLRNRQEQAQKIGKGIERTIHGLSATEKRAVFHTVSGLIPVEGTAQDIRAAVERRRGQIIDEHRGLMPKGAQTPNDERVLAYIERNHPQILRSDRELGALNFIDQHAEQIAGNPKLVALHGQARDLSKELSALDPGLRNLTAERHPHRVQGESLGVKYEPPKQAEGMTAQEFRAARDSYDRGYIQRVRSVAQAHGLPEPTFFHHQPHSVIGRADRTAGNVSRAIAGPKESGLKLFRQGRVYTGPEVLVSGLAKNIKRRHQWEGVATAFEQNALPWSRGPKGQGMSPGRLLEEIDKRGLNPADYSLVNMGRFRQEARTLGQAAEGDNRLTVEAHSPQDVADAIKSAGAGNAEAQQFLKQQGLVAVPRKVADELQAHTRAPNPVSRLFGKLQGISSGVILGLSPSWLQMQVAANSLLTGIGTHGNIKDVLGQAWHGDRILTGLSPQARQHLDESIGIGAFEGHTQVPHLGSVADHSKLLQHVQRLGDSSVTVKGRTLHFADANPMRVMFRMDNAQNNFFRRTVLYNAAKRQAYSNLRRDAGLAVEAQARVANLLRLRPNEEVTAQIQRVLENPRDVERLATHTNNLLGDYLRFTSKERNIMKPMVMFYGFLRYALKTLFYTLPVKHPMAAALAGKVGQLHDEEIRRIFGTHDVPPWVFSRLFRYNADGSVRRNAKGQIESIDLARISPVSSPVTNIVEESAAKHGTVLSPLIGMINPMFQIGLDQAYARNSFTGKGFKVHGSAEENPAPDVVARGRIMANQLLSMAAPYRLAEQVTQPGTQGDDTLLGSPRPIHYKTPGTQAQEAQRRAQRPSIGTVVGQQMTPFFFPRGDTTEQYLQRHPPADRTGPTQRLSPAQQRERTLLLREAQQAQQGSAASGRERRLLIREAQLAVRGS